MNKLFALVAAGAVLTAFGAAPASAFFEDNGCSSRPGQRQQRPAVSIRETGKQILFKTPTAEQRYVRDEAMTLLMNVSNLARKDVTVTSGYRSCNYTRAIRGRNRSQHTQGNAADFKVEGLDNKGHFDICRRAGGQGCGYYCGNFGHIDIGRYRSWNHCGRR